MDTRELIKMLAGAVIFTLIVLGITLLLPGTGKANTTKAKDTVVELGTAMKGWAMAFGGKLEKSGFVQYQKKNFEQAKEQLARNRTQIANLFEKLGGFIGNVGKNQK